MTGDAVPEPLCACLPPMPDAVLSSWPFAAVGAVVLVVLYVLLVVLPNLRVRRARRGETIGAFRGRPPVAQQTPGSPPASSGRSVGGRPR